MNQTTQQFQTQVVSQMINKMDDVLTETLNQKCSSVVQLLKSKCYDVSQMSDECRRTWLLFLLYTCDQVEQFCIKSGMNLIRGTNTIKRDLSYDKQIALTCVRFYNLIAETTCKMSNYNGRLKKSWLDCLECVSNRFQTWSMKDEESDSESEYEESDSECDCN
jgi:hypothetical protein